MNDYNGLQFLVAVLTAAFGLYLLFGVGAGLAVAGVLFALDSIAWDAGRGRRP